jgi:hypothetical protein
VRPGRLRLRVLLPRLLHGAPPPRAALHWLHSALANPPSTTHQIAYAGAKIANGFRLRYLDAVLRQDATFFDHAAPGSVSVMLEDAAIDIQEGLSDKFCAAVQGVCQVRPPPPCSSSWASQCPR